MGQKVNPIAVRLNYNRLSDSSWFSDYYYSALLYQDLNIRQYLSSIKQPNANKLGFRTAKCIIHHFPKRSLIHLFCLSDPRKKGLAPHAGAPSKQVSKAAMQADRWASKPNLNTKLTAAKQPLSVADGSESPVAPNDNPNRLQANLIAPRTSRYQKNTRIIRAYWLKSSILQKKRALVNLHRGIAESLTQVCSAAHRSWRANTGYRRRLVLRPGWLQRFSSNLTSHRNGTKSYPSLANLAVPCGKLPLGSGVPDGTDWEQKLHWRFLDCADAASPKKSMRSVLNQPQSQLNRMQVPNEYALLPKIEAQLLQPFRSEARKPFSKNSPEQITVKNRQCSSLPTTEFRLRSYFNFFALHYFFMQKTNNSNSITFTANTIWPSLRCIQTNSNRQVWQLLSLDRPTETHSFESKYCLGTSWFSVQPVDSQDSVFEEGSDSAASSGYNRLHRTKSIDFYLSHVNFILSQKTNTFVSLRPIKVRNIFQCAFLVAQEVACKLEQKKSFRLICRLIFQQLAVCNYIKGIRIACSGRLNGAEIAKTECRKFGETSLHVFSDKIDYARTNASTPYGILGVKVWISFI